MSILVSACSGTSLNNVCARMISHQTDFYIPKKQNNVAFMYDMHVIVHIRSCLEHPSEIYSEERSSGFRTISTIAIYSCGRTREIKSVAVVELEYWNTFGRINVCRDAALPSW